MSFRLMLSVLLTVPFLAIPSLVLATTVYVNDVVHVPLRSGQGDQYRILYIAKSGTPLELREQAEGSEWSKVYYAPKEIEGWVKNQYLSKTPIAAERLAQAEKNIGQLKQALSESRQQVRELEEKNRALTNQLNQLEQEKNRLEKRLAHVESVSADPLKLDKTNRELSEKVASQSNLINELQTRNLLLSEDRSNEYFVRGVLTVVLALIAGILAGRRLGKKRSSWT